jgi:hypothetical protein
MITFNERQTKVTEIMMSIYGKQKKRKATKNLARRSRDDNEHYISARRTMEKEEWEVFTHWKVVCVFENRTYM